MPKKAKKAQDWTFAHGPAALKGAAAEDFLTVEMDTTSAFRVIDDLLQQVKHIVEGDQSPKRVRLTLVGKLQKDKP